MAKIFSVPLNPKLTVEQYNEFLSFLKEYKDLISDVYFTSRISPFNQDAMGDLFVLREDYNYAIDAALNIQRTLDIPISATFNNIQIAPTQTNLDTFIYNFQPLYEAGIKIATIPHTHWMATGQIKKAFPELYVKNTILRDVRTATEIVNLAKYGFDYINLDRDLMRDRDTLLRLKQAKQWIKLNLNKEIKFSLLANEGCIGNCSMMVEHFEFNNTRTVDQPQYFNDPISRVSCPKWDYEDPSVPLKTANLPPWKEDWEDFLNNLGIDTFKMHGRESVNRLYETMEIIRRWANDEIILDDRFNGYIESNNLIEKPINVWRAKIKNCKFDCWECRYCDEIYQKKSGIEHDDLIKHVVQCVSDSGVPKIDLGIPGLTSTRVQTLLNSLAKGVDTYLEIGSYLGASVCAVMKDNPIVATVVDTWETDVAPATGGMLPPTSLQRFEENIKLHKGDSIVNVIKKDMFDVDISQLIGTVKLFFYDGPHDRDTTQKAVEYYWPALRNQAIMVFDDANWREVVEGARAGLNNVDARIDYEKLMLNSEENPHEWWNGLYILVVGKN